MVIWTNPEVGLDQPGYIEEQKESDDKKGVIVHEMPKETMFFVYSHLPTAFE